MSNPWPEELTRPNFAEEVVLPMRESGYDGIVVELFPRSWWKVWKPRYTRAYWSPCVTKPAFGEWDYGNDRAVQG